MEYELLAMQAAMCILGQIDVDWGNENYRAKLCARLYIRNEPNMHCEIRTRLKWPVEDDIQRKKKNARVGGVLSK